MDKVRIVFEGVVVIGLLLFVDITALSLCLKGICEENWVATNVTICSIIEVILCIWIYNHIRKGAIEILRKTRNLELLKELYTKVKYYTLFGVFFGVWQLCEALGIFTVSVEDTRWQFVYACNVLGVALLFFLWMHFSVKEIKKRQELWLKITTIIIGYWNSVTYFLFVYF